MTMYDLTNIRERDLFIRDHARGTLSLEDAWESLEEYADSDVYYCIVAMFLWGQGDTAMAQYYAERSLDVNPDYSLTYLVLAAIDAGLPADEWYRVVGSLSDDQVMGIAPLH